MATPQDNAPQERDVQWPAMKVYPYEKFEKELRAEIREKLMQITSRGGEELKFTEQELLTVETELSYAVWLHHFQKARKSRYEWRFFLVPFFFVVAACMISAFVTIVRLEPGELHPYGFKPLLWVVGGIVLLSICLLIPIAIAMLVHERAKDREALQYQRALLAAYFFEFLDRTTLPNPLQTTLLNLKETLTKLLIQLVRKEPRWLVDAHDLSAHTERLISDALAEKGAAARAALVSFAKQSMIFAAAGHFGTNSWVPPNKTTPDPQWSQDRSKPVVRLLQAFMHFLPLIVLLCIGLWAIEQHLKRLYPDQIVATAAYTVLSGFVLGTAISIAKKVFPDINVDGLFKPLGK